MERKTIFIKDLIKENAKFKPGTRSLANLKLINGFKMTKMDSTSRCNTKLLEKYTNENFNKQPKSILFETSSYKNNQIHRVKKLTAKVFYFISL